MQDKIDLYCYTALLFLFLWILYNGYKDSKQELISITITDSDDDEED